MKISRSSSASDLLQRCEPWLLQSEARNNLMLGIARRFCGELASSDSGNYWATASDDGELLGAAFPTPPYPLAVSDMPLEVLPLLVSDVSDVFANLPGVSGPVPVARALADFGCTCRRRMHSRTQRSSIAPLLKFSHCSANVHESIQRLLRLLVRAQERHCDIFVVWSVIERGNKRPSW